MNDVEDTERSRLPEIRAERLAEIRVAEHVQAVIHRHRDHVAANAQIRAVVHGRGARARVEPAAVAPERDGPPPAIGYAGCPDVQHETVFALGLSAARALLIGLAPRRGLALRSARSIRERVAHARPFRGIDGRHEAVRAPGARAVRNAFERFDAFDLRAAHAAERGLGFDVPNLAPTKVSRCRWKVRRASILA